MNTITDTACPEDIRVIIRLKAALPHRKNHEKSDIQISKENPNCLIINNKQKKDSFFFDKVLPP